VTTDNDTEDGGRREEVGCHREEAISHTEEVGGQIA
jgi:hypothetical protein